MLAKSLFFLSGLLWAVEMIPQLIKTYKRKTVKDISFWFPLIALISMSLYFVASTITKNWILIISTSMPFVCNIIFLTQILIYRRNNEFSRLHKGLSDKQFPVEQIGNV